MSSVMIVERDSRRSSQQPLLRMPTHAAILHCMWLSTATSTSPQIILNRRLYCLLGFFETCLAFKSTFMSSDAPQTTLSQGKGFLGSGLRLREQPKQQPSHGRWSCLSLQAQPKGCFFQEWFFRTQVCKSVHAPETSQKSQSIWSGFSSLKLRMKLDVPWFAVQHLAKTHF